MLAGRGARHRADRAAAPRPGRGPARWLAGHHARVRPPRAPHPGAQLTLFEAEDGWRYSLWVTNLPTRQRGWRADPAYIDAAHRVHARVEDAVRTGKDTGIGKFPSQAFALNQAWLAAALIAATLLAWLKLLALDGPLAKAEPKTLRYRILHTAARLTRSGRRRHLKIAATWPWAPAIVTAWDPITALPKPPDQQQTVPTARKERPRGARGTPGHPARQPGHRHTPALKSRSTTRAGGCHKPATGHRDHQG
jgi:hypothetical protein